uniref:Tudor domain-containing protein n=1 Tax=Parascaris univalens TaxID=6257 RepID=A0A915BR03_PARUN
MGYPIDFEKTLPYEGFFFLQTRMAGFAKISAWDEQCDKCDLLPSSSNKPDADSFPSSSSKDTLLEHSEQIAPSDHKEMIMVETGTEWRLRKMSDMYPQYCWKYADSSVLIYYHFNMAANGVEADAPSKCANASRPVFYAKIPYEFSPYDFSVRPKSLDKACMQLRERMCAFYDTHDLPVFKKDELFSGMACVIRSGGDWRRARILEYYGGLDVLTEVVDYGTENLGDASKVRPLMKEFGRLPPLALRCRMKDVCINDLTAAKVAAFQTLLADCERLVRVELANVSCVPYLVNLYHPTIEGRNLGVTFYPREVHPEHEAARERRWQTRMAQMENRTNAEEDEDYQSDFEDEPEELPHVRYLERLEKPIGSSRLYVCHVENSRFIYLHSEYHSQAVEDMEKQLNDKWPTLSPFPRGLISPHTACAYLERDGPKSHVYRVIVSKMTEAELEIRAADHGWKKILPVECCYNGSLRILTKQFADTPFMYVCRFPSAMEHHPHFSETTILRRILPDGSAVNVHCERTKGGPPYKAEFTNDEGQNIWDIVEKIKEEEHTVHPCFEVVRYCSERVRALSFNVPADYREELEIFTPFAKGRLQLTNFFSASNRSIS